MLIGSVSPILTSHKTTTFKDKEKLLKFQVFFVIYKRIKSSWADEKSVSSRKKKLRSKLLDPLFVIS